MGFPGIPAVTKVVRKGRTFHSLFLQIVKRSITNGEIKAWASNGERTAFNQIDDAALGDSSLASPPPSQMPLFPGIKKRTMAK